MARIGGRSRCSRAPTRTPAARSARTRTVVAPHTKAGRKIVDKALAALIVEVENGRVNLGDDPTLAHLLDRWVDARSPEWSPKTTLENEWQIRLKIVPRMGTRRLSKIRAADLDALYSELRKRGSEKGGALAPASVRRVHIILHAALEQAVKWGLIATNPADAATPPKLPPGRITPPAPTDLAKAMKLVDEYDEDFAMYVRLAATTGARRSQVCALRWSDVDLEAKTITFARGMILGGKDVGVVERQTKTGLVWKVAISEATRQRLSDYKALCERRAEAVHVKLAKKGFVFAAEPDGNEAFATGWRDMAMGTLAQEGRPRQDREFESPLPDQIQSSSRIVIVPVDRARVGIPRR